MKKISVVLAASAIAAFTGCKDPAYQGIRTSTQNEAKDVEVTPPSVEEPTPIEIAPVEPPPEPVVEVKEPVVIPEPEPEYTIYIVQRGDYLAKISKKYNVTINGIKKLNPSLKNDVIRIGQKLKLPGKIDVGEQKEPEKVIKAPATTSKTGKFVPYTGATEEYTVKSGDTLGAIAYGNGINIRQLKDLNKLTSDNLKIGQKLKIPAGKGAAVAATKPAEVKEKAVVEPVKTETPAPAPVVDDATIVNEDVVEPTPVETPVVAEPEAAPLTYVVQEGDDITGVSIHWGVSAASIRELNNLNENDQLEPGQVIKLPADAQQ